MLTFEHSQFVNGGREITRLAASIKYEKFSAKLINSRYLFITHITLLSIYYSNTSTHLLSEEAVGLDGLSPDRDLAPPLVAAGLLASSNDTNSFTLRASLNPSGVTRISSATPAVYTSGNCTRDKS